MSKQKNSRQTDNIHKAIEDNQQIPFAEAQAINAETQQDESARAVTTWKPEDAANFLAKAIQEAQRPMTKVLARRMVPESMVWLIIFVMTLFIGGTYYRLHLTEAKLLAVETNAEKKSAEVQDQENVDKLKTIFGKITRDINETRVYKSKIKQLEEIVDAKGRQLRSANKLISKGEKAQEQAEKFKAEIDKLKLRLKDKKKQTDLIIELQKKAVKYQNLAKRGKQASILLSEQLDAQTEAIAALQKQLSSARKLVHTLQTDDPENTVPQPQVNNKAKDKEKRETVKNSPKLTRKKDKALETQPKTKKQDDSKKDMIVPEEEVPDDSDRIMM